MSELPWAKGSFFLGQDRGDGLRLKLVFENGMVTCDVNVDTRFEGYEGVVHGGMVFGILDVMMWYAIFLSTRKVGLTRKTDMDFLRPVLCERTYKARARFLRMEEKDIFASAWIEDDEGQVCAEVTGLFREMKGMPDAHFLSLFEYSASEPWVREVFIPATQTPMGNEYIPGKGNVPGDIGDRKAVEGEGASDSAD